MKHCVLMTAYKDSKLINRIITQLPEDWGVFVSLDKKSTIEPNHINNATVIKRHKVYWGSFEHVESFIDLMNIAINDKQNYDCFHLITGQDYPLFNETELKSFDFSKCYIECFSIPRAGWKKWSNGYSFYRDKYPARFFDMRKGIWRILHFIKKWVGCIKLKKFYLPNYPIYGGSVYCTLPRDAVDYILKSNITQNLRKRLRNSLCGEETFFQTILMNGPYKDKIINNNLRFTDWNVPNPPKILKYEDYAKVCERGCLFMRKVALPESESLLKIIDAK